MGTIVEYIMPVSGWSLCRLCIDNEDNEEKELSGGKEAYRYRGNGETGPCQGEYRTGYLAGS